MFIALAAVLALSVGLIGCEGEGPAPDVWDYEVELTLHPTISQFASICELVIFPWVDAVHALEGDDGGTFNITIVTPGDSPYDAASSLSAISIATTDIGMLSPETFHLGGAGYLPFEFDSIEQTAYVMYKLWTENNAEWDETNQLAGVKILMTMPLWGSQLWTTSNGGNVTQASEMADLLIRTDAQAVESATIQALGALPQWIGVSELAGQLGTDQIHGCFFTYSGIGGAADLGGVTSYTTELNMIYRPYSLAMNKAKYDGLPTDAKAALDSVTGLAASVAWATAHIAGEAADKADTINGPCLWGHGRNITYPNLSTFITATADIADEWATYMTDDLGFNGAGILDRIAALKAEFDAL
jgi:TRAP-type C4-dicarboxylate transport system substrate-binding protein